MSAIEQFSDAPLPLLSFSSAISSSSPLSSSDGQAPTPPASVAGGDGDVAAKELQGGIVIEAPSSTAHTSHTASSRRVVWSLAHRPSCASSPKHRFHPYAVQTGGDSDPAADISSAVTSSSTLLVSSSSTTSSSSPLAPRRASKSTTKNYTLTSPSRRLSGTSGSARSDFPHARSLFPTSPLLSSNTSSRIKPKSILKKRNSQASHHRRNSSLNFSPGRRIAQPIFRSTGIKLNFSAVKVAILCDSLHNANSPSASIRSPSTSSPRKMLSSYGTSPRSSPRNSPRMSGRPLPVIDGEDRALQEILTEITKANGSGRKHIVTYPDLRNVTATTSTGTGSKGKGRATEEASAPASSAFLDQLAKGGAAPPPPASPKIGLGLLPAPGYDPVQSIDSNSNTTQIDADPRTYIISSMHTLKHSLVSPVWYGEDGNGNGQDDSAGKDIFESVPVDFAPRNLPETRSMAGQSDADVTNSTPSPVLRAPIQLRELENAYATIFTYVQAWLASPQRLAAIGTEVRDNLDEQFDDLADVLVACLYRDIYHAIHPVPLPSVAVGAQRDASEAASAVAGRSESITFLMQGAATADPTTADSDFGPVASTSAADPVAVPNPASSSPLPIAKIDAPKKTGRSTTETRRRRNELHVAEAALQAAGAVLSDGRFWEKMKRPKLISLLVLVSSIPSSNQLTGTKHREVVASVNWLVANQTLSRTVLLEPVPDSDIASVAEASTSNTVLQALVHAVLKSLSCTGKVSKNGEKAKRASVEALRAFRALLFVCSTETVRIFLNEAAAGTITSCTTFLSSAVKPLRDNSAAFLAALAWALTTGWTDRTEAGVSEQTVCQDKVSAELHKYWSSTVKSPALLGFSNAITCACERGNSGIAGEYSFARLTVNTLPVLLGRRLRKMEHKGPHRWLEGVIKIRESDMGDDCIAFHLATFVHVVYSWAVTSTETARKGVPTVANAETAGGAPLQMPKSMTQQSLKQDDMLWGINDRALRVILQNIDSTEKATWTEDRYAASQSIRAASCLLVSLIYTFSGIIATLPTSSVNDRYFQWTQLTRLWDAVIARQLPRLLQSTIVQLHLYAWSLLEAICRSGEEHPVEDAAAQRWRVERVVNARLLGYFASAAGQTPNIQLVLDEMPLPSEVPSFDAQWVLACRDRILTMFRKACSGVTNFSLEHIDAIEWTRSEDGFRIFPARLSSLLRTLMTTIRSALPQERPSEAALEVVDELMKHLLALTAELRLPESLLADLPQEAAEYAMVQHFSETVRETFGFTSHALLADVLESRRPAESASGLVQSAFFSLFAHAYDKSTTDIPPLQAIRVGEWLQTLPGKLPTSCWMQWSTQAVPIATDDAQNDEDRTHLAMVVLSQAPDLGTKHCQERFTHILLRTWADPNEAWLVLQDLREQRLATVGADANSGPMLDCDILWHLFPHLHSLGSVDGFNTALAAALRSALVESTVAPAQMSSKLSTILEAVGRAYGHQAIFATLSEATIAGIRARIDGLYRVALGAFERVFHTEKMSIPLSDFELLLVSGVESVDSESNDEAFVRCWNATYGTCAEDLAYSYSLTAIFDRLLLKSYDISLPGWPKASISLQESEQAEAIGHIAAMDLESANLESANLESANLESANKEGNAAKFVLTAEETPAVREEGRPDCQADNNMVNPCMSLAANAEQIQVVPGVTDHTLETPATAPEQRAAPLAGLTDEGHLWTRHSITFPSQPPLSQILDISNESYNLAIEAAETVQETPQSVPEARLDNASLLQPSHLDAADSQDSIMELPETQYFSVTNPDPVLTTAQVAVRSDVPEPDSPVAVTLPASQTAADVDSLDSQITHLSESFHASVASPSEPVETQTKTILSTTMHTLPRKRKLCPHVSVVIPYRADVHRPWLNGGDCSQSLADSLDSDGNIVAKRKTQTDSGKESARITAPLKQSSRTFERTRSEALQPRSTRPPLRAAASVPILMGQSQDNGDSSDDDLRMSSSSSPAKRTAIFDHADSLTLKRKRIRSHDNVDHHPPSSPLVSAWRRSTETRQAQMSQRKIPRDLKKALRTVVGNVGSHELDAALDTVSAAELKDLHHQFGEALYRRLDQKNQV